MAVPSPRSTTAASNVLSPASNSSNPPHSRAHLARPLLRKAGRAELDLGLKFIIGTTTNSSNAFAALPGSRCIGYLAGTVAVVGKVNDDGSISQTFFRSKQLLIPNAGGAPLAEISSNPLNLANNARNHTPVRHRDSPNSPSSFTSSAYALPDTPGSKNGNSVLDKIKPLVSISFSPSGKLLAVGEVGHKPRVLIYSLRYAGQDHLLSTISEHTFGVRLLSFSPDSQLLASLGDVNDGFLYIWRVNDRTGAHSLLASNKCTTVVKDMAWLGKNLVTVGTRHVKVWTVETTIIPEAGNKPLADQLSTLSLDSPRTLSGHNCLLGSLLDRTFTAIVIIAHNKAVVCSEDGDICLLENAEASARLTPIGVAGFHVHTATLLSPSLLLVGGHNGRMRLFGLQKLLVTPEEGDTVSCDQGVEVTVGQTSNTIIAMGFLGRELVILDNKRTLQTLPCDPSGTIDSKVCTISAHGGTPKGVLSLPQPNKLRSAFMTWDSIGSVLFWDQSGGLKHQVHVRLRSEQVEEGDYLNELSAVRLNAESTRVVSGDRYGIMRVTDVENGDCIRELKAHHGDITDIAIGKCSGNWSIITGGRDRMIQVFHWQNSHVWLVQTLDDHVGAVTSLLLLQDTQRLVSCSADRNITIRDFVSREIDDRTVSAYIKTRSIVLKATPLSMAVNLKRKNDLIVSTKDKQVLEYDMSTGNTISAFKSSDLEDSSSVVLSEIVQIPDAESNFVAGVSNSDKSIRIYDPSGNLRARDYGHTEGLTSICLVNSSNESEGYSLVTTAMDGTIYIWKPQLGNHENTNGLQDPVKVDSQLANQTPVRRVISATDLAQLQELRAPGEKAEGGTTSRPASPKRNPSKLSQVQVPDATTSTVAQAPRRMSKAIPPPLLISVAPSPTRTGRSGSVVRSQSPASPRAQSPTLSATKSRFTDEGNRRRKSLSTGTPTSAEPNIILLATEQMCRSLQFYRKKLAVSDGDKLPVATVRELEKELAATTKMLTARHGEAQQLNKSDDTHNSSMAASSPIPSNMDEERLMDLLESRLEARLLSKMGQGRVSQHREHVTTSGTTEKDDAASMAV